MKKILFLFSLLPAILFGQDNMNIVKIQSMGSVVKAMTVGVYSSNVTGEMTMADGRIYFIPVYLQKATILTGVKLFITTQGAYTADNNNKVGLYTVSGGTATLVASCADDGNLWKATANTFIIKAFSSTYVATEGLYYVGFVYNRSAATVDPKIAKSYSLANAAATVGDFTNSNKLSCYVAGADLPGSFAMNTTTNYTETIWVAIY